MSNFEWAIVMKIGAVLWSEVSPKLKAAALEELQTFRTKYPLNPLLDALVAEAEKLVTAA